MGPHGLCIGATGSGKSEFLRTVALGMIVGHSPEELNLVLVDFKGGATFSGLEPAPHVAAVITNLSDKAALVARMRDALMGEMNRRQEVLRAAGNLDGIAAYQRRRRADARLDPLPTLFIIVDEFSELLSQHPDFADVFVAIGRLGRSLGVHLLLASQRLDEGRLRGLESHLSYRVCLKTLSVNESRVVLGTSEAYELPGTPGAAYLRVGTDAPVRFQTAFVSGHPAERSAADELARCRNAIRGQRSSACSPVKPSDLSRVGAAPRRTRVNAPPCCKRSSDGYPQTARRAHEVWLPPLGSAPALNTVLRDAGPVPALTAPIGIVDRPFEQRRTPLIVDLSRAAGNVALVGAPQSGKSTALRTLITALAVTSRSAHGAVLLPRLRRRRVGLAARLAARRLGRGTSRSGAGAPHARSTRRCHSFARDAVPRARHRVDRALSTAQGEAGPVVRPVRRYLSDCRRVAEPAT